MISDAESKFVFVFVDEFYFSHKRTNLFDFGNDGCIAAGVRDINVLDDGGKVRDYGIGVGERRKFWQQLVNVDFGAVDIFLDCDLWFKIDS